jgi:hypothetical protein
MKFLYFAVILRIMFRGFPEWPIYVLLVVLALIFALKFTIVIFIGKNGIGKNWWSKLLTSTCGILQKEVWATQTLKKYVVIALKIKVSNSS